MDLVLKEIPTPTAKVERFRINKNGYYVFDNGRLVHRHVYYSAFPKVPRGYHVHHINGRKLDNALDNLIALPPLVHKALHQGFPMWRLPDREKISEWQKKVTRTKKKGPTKKRKKKRRWRRISDAIQAKAKRMSKGSIWDGKSFSDRVRTVSA